MAITILGISPGTRTIGIAVLKDYDLIEWQVKTYRGRWTKEKLKLIIGSLEKLCDHFRIDGVALKETSPLRSSSGLILLTKSILDVAHKKNLTASLYTLDDLKRGSSSTWKHTKDELMEFITEKYAVLRKEYLKERNSLRPYYLKMFEAIAAARILTREVDVK